MITAGDTLDEAMQKACEVLEFIAEFWLADTGNDCPLPRSLDTLRTDPDFLKHSRDAVVAVIPLRSFQLPAAAE
jgi:hypothetical protein